MLSVRSSKLCELFYKKLAQTSESLDSLFVKNFNAAQTKRGAVKVMEKMYEIQQIKQVIKEVEGSEKHIVRSPIDAALVAAEIIGDEDREVFLVMCLNTKNRIVAVHRCHVGSLAASIVHPREVFKSAILNNAMSIIVSHQHPSGDTTPSREDIEVTRRLIEAGKVLGIEVLDHLIVNAHAEFTSLKEKGYL